jgi:uncharacterized membrane protein
MTLLTLESFYWLIGAIFAFLSAQVAGDRAHPKRWGTALFWGLLAAIYLFGKMLPPALVGYLLVAMVVLAALKQVAKSAERSTTREERAASAERLKNRLFRPALLVPVCAIVGTFMLGRIHWGDIRLVDPKQVTLIALGLGALVATAVAWRMTGDRLDAPLHEGSRLLQAVGWALILPQMLAALGAIFARAGVDRVVSGLMTDLLPTHVPFVAVAAYCLGMALFTMCMGNAFAAFAAITGGIGLPFVVQLHHGNPAIMAAIGMLSGYCGTLLTPMAANFNIVPAMLLELKDRNAVIKAQVPIGLAILTANILIMYITVYRF